MFPELEEDFFMRRFFCLLAVLVLALSACSPAFALSADTLHYGSRGEEVRSLQQALISLGYLKGSADGIFGYQTEKAVKSYQKASGLTVDVLAGKATRDRLLRDASSGSASSQPASPASRPASTEASVSPSSGASSGSLFGSNYATIRMKDQGDRVQVLQQALIRLKYLSGKADGIFGQKTLSAVILFQKENNLSADGLAGKKTLTALEKAVQSGDVRESASQTPAAPAPSSSASSSSSAPAYTSSALTGEAPDGSKVHLLHWFNDIKPSLKARTNLLIYDPSSGLSWTLRIHSCGRHCDAEPLTKEDTETMLKAFGGENTWNQKGVYVKLPSGVWTIGSTHDMPHLSGSIKDNGFDGHLCVHFLRDMAEAELNDPNYGVANQKTIRSLWKSITGEELSY